MQEGETQIATDVEAQTLMSTKNKFNQKDQFGDLMNMETQSETTQVSWNKTKGKNKWNRSVRFNAPKPQCSNRSIKNGSAIKWLSHSNIPGLG
jgi:hypothetical protein